MSVRVRVTVGFGLLILILAAVTIEAAIGALRGSSDHPASAGLVTTKSETSSNFQGITGRTMD